MNGRSRGSGLAVSRRVRSAGCHAVQYRAGVRENEQPQQQLRSSLRSE